MKCSICFKDIDVTPYWDQGHNAEPVNNGRCCSICNDTVVIPARITLIFNSKKQNNNLPNTTIPQNKRYK